MTLSELPLNQAAFIRELPNDVSLIAKLLEHGLVPNTQIQLAHKAPFNGPVAIVLHGTKMSMPSQLAKQIKVQLASES